MFQLKHCITKWFYAKCWILLAYVYILIATKSTTLFDGIFGFAENIWGTLFMDPWWISTILPALKIVLKLASKPIKLRNFIGIIHSEHFTCRAVWVCVSMRPRVELTDHRCTFIDFNHLYHLAEVLVVEADWYLLPLDFKRSQRVFFVWRTKSKFFFVIISNNNCYYVNVVKMWTFAIIKKEERARFQ